jgi:hypothetical protein
MADVFRCYDINGILVICTKFWWDNHIVTDHLEMRGCEAHVKVAIENPYQIYQDGSKPDHKNIYKPFILPKPFHTQYLRVGIKYKKSKFGKLKGFVATAFACRSKKQGDILIWEQP